MRSPESDVLDYQVRGGTAFVTLNRPHALNALDTALRGALHEAFVAIADDPEVRVVVLAGAGGRAFSTGADLKELAATGTGQPGGPVIAGRGLMLGFDDVERCRKPIIAAIDGYCLAGGFELALYCDIRIATRSSTFGLPEPRRGLIGGPGLVHLSRMVPWGEALLIHLTGAPMGAERAHQIGLVQFLAEDAAELNAVVDATATDLLACSPRALSAIKRVVREGRDLSVHETWTLVEALWDSDNQDVAEGVRAFAEHRAPRWSAPPPA
jgi:enoyl-CoA hydratase/carnithine racemase